MHIQWMMASPTRIHAHPVDDCKSHTHTCTSSGWWQVPHAHMHIQWMMASPTRTHAHPVDDGKSHTHTCPSSSGWWQDVPLGDCSMVVSVLSSWQSSSCFYFKHVQYWWWLCSCCVVSVPVLACIWWENVLLEVTQSPSVSLSLSTSPSLYLSLPLYDQTLAELLLRICITTMIYACHCIWFLSCGVQCLMSYMV